MAPLCTGEAAACEPRGRKMGAAYKSGLPFLLQRLSASLLWHFPLCSSVLLLVSNSWSHSSGRAFLRNLLLTHQNVVSWTFAWQQFVQAAVLVHLWPSLVCDLKCPMKARESYLSSVWLVRQAGCGQEAVGLVPLSWLLIIIQTTYHFI